MKYAKKINITAYRSNIVITVDMPTHNEGYQRLELSIDYHSKSSFPSIKEIQADINYGRDDYLITYQQARKIKDQMLIARFGFI